MGTEVLRPQDCLIEHIRLSPAAFQNPRPKNFGNGNGSPNNQRVSTRKPTVRSVQKKKNGRSHHGNLMMEEVTILRRGEPLDPTINVLKNTSDDLVLCGTERLNPDPEQIRICDLKSVFSPPSASCERRDVYAGSTVFFSPSPRALPLPSFFSKKKSVGDFATRDLRRLLQLN